MNQFRNLQPKRTSFNQQEYSFHDSAKENRSFKDPLNLSEGELPTRLTFSEETKWLVEEDMATLHLDSSSIPPRRENTSFSTNILEMETEKLRKERNPLSIELARRERERTKAMNEHFNKHQEREDLLSAIHARDEEVRKYHRRTSETNTDLARLRLSSIKAQAILSGYRSGSNYPNPMEAWGSSKSYSNPISNGFHSSYSSNRSYTPYSSLSKAPYDIPTDYLTSDPRSDSLWRDPSSFRKRNSSWKG